MDKLLDYQKSHVESIINSLVIYNRALDASDTGTGKTFSSVCVCKIIGWKPFIICPKSVIASWIKVLEFFKCDYYGITNYELMQNCTYYTPEGTKEKLKFLTRQAIIVEPKNDPLGLDSTDSSDSEEIKYEYKWICDKIPDDILFIFDEAHRCKNAKTNNGQIIYNLASIKNIKILILSATVVDKPKYFILTGYILGLYNSIKNGKSWIKKLPYKTNQMEGVHKHIYPEYASRMKITNLKNDFPECSIIAESRLMDNAVDIQAAYDDIREAVEELKKHELASSPLAKIIYGRQRIELLKIPEFIKLTQEHINEGKSVVLFVNFTDTLLELSSRLNTKCLIYGEQKIDDRNKNIEDFQTDKERIIICNIKAGGVGISLHDTIGNFPRVSIISPTWSAQDLIQVLGRLFRAKTKTKVVQKIIFCKGTVEDDICKMIQEKVANIAFINDGSMDSYKIEGLTDNILQPNCTLDIKLNELTQNQQQNQNEKQNQKQNEKQNQIEKQKQNENKFSQAIEKISKLYERKQILSKELELLNKEIIENETIINNFIM